MTKDDRNDQTERTGRPRRRPGTEEVEPLQILSEELSLEASAEVEEAEEAEGGEAEAALPRRRVPPPLPPRRLAPNAAVPRQTQEVASAQIVSSRPVTARVPKVPGPRSGPR